jgi:hypothetical protein
MEKNYIFLHFILAVENMAMTLWKISFFVNIFRAIQHSPCFDSSHDPTRGTSKPTSHSGWFISIHSPT